ncbi:Hypothetical protein I5071_67960 [Sandaracinus amylolyticus]|nr:Hypothetical protein I5071_67960 [Sandaracinus amylolyticus]
MVVLATSLSGCFSIAAAALGGHPSTVRAAGELDGALLGAIVDAATGTPSDDDEVLVATVPEEGDVYACRLETGEVHLVNAHSIEGARAVCLMSNDVDLRGASCACALIVR